SSQKAAVVVDLDDLLAGLLTAAKGRQRDHGKTAPGRGRTLPQEVEEVSPSTGEVNQQLADVIGTNRQYVADARKLKAEAPHLHARVRGGEGTLRAAAAAFRDEKRKATKHEVEAVLCLPDNDPPWRVERADALEWFAAQPADSLDLVFGSPPYEGQRLYLEG